MRSAVRTVVRQVLRWNGTNVGIDHPGDDPRHAAAERHKFNLDVNAVVLLEIAGIEVRSPHIPVVVSDRQLLLFKFVAILHLGDTNGASKAVPSGAVAQEVIDVEFYVVYGCDNGMS